MHRTGRASGRTVSGGSAESVYGSAHHRTRTGTSFHTANIKSKRPAEPSVFSVTTFYEETVRSNANSAIGFALPYRDVQRGLSVARIVEWPGTSSAMLERHYNRFLVQRTAHFYTG